VVHSPEKASLVAPTGAETKAGQSGRKEGRMPLTAHQHGRFIRLRLPDTPAAESLLAQASDFPATVCYSTKRRVILLGYANADEAADIYRTEVPALALILN